MFGNITNAVESGVKNKARGMVLTDWGDMGHWQYLPVSYTGFAYAGGLSWNPEIKNTKLIQSHLNQYVFKDSQDKIGSIVLNLGRYNQFEEIEMVNMTMTMLAYQFGFVDQTLVSTIMVSMQDTFKELLDPSQFEMLSNRFDNPQRFQYDGLMEFLDRQEESLATLSIETADGDLIKSEFTNGARMVRLGGEMKNYINQKNDWSNEERVAELTTMKVLVDETITEHRRLWLERNKSGGLEKSLEKILDLQKGIEKQLELNQKGGFALWLDRLKEKLIAAGAALYLG
jgi:hypothetical protein